jgi:16S rRNA (uracil1498-N3)-methyltransferase
MSVPRFYVPLPLAEGQVLALPPSAAHHAARVLRLRPGDAVILFNGEGGEYEAVITAIGKHDVQAQIGKHRSIDRESPLSITLVQAISSGERMDHTIQKAVELGVMRIIPVDSERTVVRLTGERATKRVLHWQQIVISACEQCGRNRVPPVQAIMPLAGWLASPAGDALRWMLLPGAEATLREREPPDRPIELLVGPEGGLTDDEIATARQAAFRPLCLGPRVLRTETAAPAFLAAAQALWGDV